MAAVALAAVSLPVLPVLPAPASATATIPALSSTVASWGNSTYGSLGNGSFTASTVPVATTTSGVLAGRRITKVAAGGGTTCVIAEGAAYCWGRNDSGQVGSNTTSSAYVATPANVSTATGLAGKTVTDISVGATHACAVADGAAYCWGSNAYGQLGTGSTMPSVAYSPVAVLASGALQGLTVTAIAAGDKHTCAIASGAAYCWGRNNNGQLGAGYTSGGFGIPDFITSPTAVSTSGILSGVTLTAITAGDATTCALASSAYCWGANNDGQLGNGGYTQSTSPMYVTFPSVPSTALLGIDLGGTVACAWTATAVHCWGKGDYGQQANGSYSDRPWPTRVLSALIDGRDIGGVSVGDNHACAIASGAAYCWGGGSTDLAVTYGERLGGGKTAMSLVPLAVVADGVLAGKRLIAIAAGGVHTALITEPLAPGAPAAVSLEGGSGEVTVTVTAPASGAVPTAYLVTSSPDAQSCVAEPASLSCTVTGLANGTSYTFEVTPYNGGVAGPSITSDAITPGSVPAAPTGLTATRGNASVALEWVAAESPDSPVVDYRIDVSTDGIEWTRIVRATPSTETAFTVTGLANGTAYAFRVFAVSTFGTGPAAQSSEVTPATVPGAPGSLAAVPGDGNITVTWSSPSDDGGSDVTGYVVELRIGSGAWAPVATISDPADTEATISGLANGTAHTVRVSAVNDVGTGDTAASDPVTPIRPAAAPTITRATPSDGEVSLEWSAPDDTGGSEITGYVVWMSRGGAAYAEIADVDDDSYAATGLVNAVSYRFRIAAVTAAGVGAAAESAAVIPARPAGAPGQPRAVRGDRSAALTWTAPTANGGSPVTGYRIEMSAAGGAWTTAVADSGSTSTSATVSDLVAGRSYSFRVRALTGVGAGAASRASTALIAATVPGAPSKPTTVRGSKRIVVGWTAPAATAGAAVTGYLIEMATGNGAFSVRVANTKSTATSYAVTGLAKGTAYRFRVSAINAIGTGAASAVVGPVSPL